MELVFKGEIKTHLKRKTFKEMNNSQKENKCSCRLSVKIKVRINKWPDHFTSSLFRPINSFWRLPRRRRLMTSQITTEQRTSWLMTELESEHKDRACSVQRQLLTSRVSPARSFTFVTHWSLQMDLLSFSFWVLDVRWPADTLRQLDSIWHHVNDPHCSPFI